MDENENVLLRVEDLKQHFKMGKGKRISTGTASYQDEISIIKEQTKEILAQCIEDQCGESSKLPY